MYSWQQNSTGLEQQARAEHCFSFCLNRKQGKHSITNSQSPSPTKSTSSISFFPSCSKSAWKKTSTTSLSYFTSSNMTAQHSEPCGYQQATSNTAIAPENDAIYWNWYKFLNHLRNYRSKYFKMTLQDKISKIRAHENYKYMWNLTVVHLYIVTTVCCEWINMESTGQKTSKLVKF